MRRRIVFVGSAGRRVLLGFGAAAVLAAGGCKSYDEYRQERAEYAVKHFERSQLQDLEEGRVLTLVDCIRLAGRNNLDLEVFKLEEHVAREMRTADMLGMLPEINVSNTLTDRNNTPGSSSRRISSDGATYGASTSQDRTVNYLNVDFALSVLDFGLAFFNTQQAEDRVLLREQRTRRAGQNLTLDVVRVYFQVAAAQRAINVTTQLLEDCRTRYELIAKMGRERQISPFRAFDETRRFIEMEKRLTNYIRSYENSCYELRSLLGLYPGAAVKVDDSILDAVPDFDLPEMIEMEQIALLQRPELYEIDMQKHINILECRKTIVTMFPNVRIFMDFTNSNNTFLYHQSWWEIGIRAAYNLLKLPQQIARYQAYSSQVDAEEARTYAQAIGVMAQVRMAHANLLATRERLDIDTKVYKAYSENLEWAKANKKMTGELSQLELDHMRLATTETEVERYLSLGNYYVSYFRILNAIGVEDLAVDSVTGLKEELGKARVRAAEELEKAKAEYAAKHGDAAAAEAAAAESLPAETTVSEQVEASAPAEPAPVPPAE